MLHTKHYYSDPWLHIRIQTHACITFSRTISNNNTTTKFSISSFFNIHRYHTLKHPLTLAYSFFPSLFCCSVAFSGSWPMCLLSKGWAEHCRVGVWVALATKPHRWLQWKCNWKRRADIHIPGGLTFSPTRCWTGCFYIFNCRRLQLCAVYDQIESWEGNRSLSSDSRVNVLTNNALSPRLRINRIIKL